MPFTVTVREARQTLLRRCRCGATGAASATASQSSQLVDINRTEGPGFWDNGELLLLSGNAVDNLPRRILSFDDVSGTFTVTPPFPAGPQQGSQYEVSRFIDLADALDILAAALADYWPVLCPLAVYETLVPASSYRLPLPSGVFADFGVQEVRLEPIVSTQGVAWPLLEEWDYLPDGQTIQLPVDPLLVHRGRRLRLVGAPPLPAVTETGSLTFLDRQRYEVFLRFAEAELWDFLARFPVELDVQVYVMRSQIARSQAERRLRQLGVMLPMVIKGPERRSRRW